MKYLIIALLLTGVFDSSICFSQMHNDSILKPAKQNSKQERLRKKHETWDSCFIVKAKGDTIYGKVDHRDDQSSVLSSYMSDLLIFFAHTNEKEEQFIPDNLKELYVFNAPEGYNKYQVIDQEDYLSNYGILYRIVVDGSCKLVARGAKNIVPGGLLDVILKENAYYLLYKKNFIPIRTEITGFNSGFPILKASAGFKKKCEKIFSECPPLVEQIESKTFRSEDLREIVKEFNNCIGKK